MKLIELLNNRYSIAKSSTKKYIEEVKKCIEDYKCEKEYSNEKDKSVYNKHLSIKRYEFPIPYIYSTHESMMSSLFEKPPELVITGKGAQDEDKAELIRSIYKYLYDKLDLEDFLANSAWWFILVGFVSSYQTYEVKEGDGELISDSEGNPMMDDNGQPLINKKYEWHDPMAYVDDPLHTYFSPESEFSVKGAVNIPYLLREKLLDKEEVMATFGLKEEEVDATEKIEIDGYKASTPEGEDDIKRVNVKYYCGLIPQEYAEEVEGWEQGKNYYITFINNKVLNIRSDEKYTTLAKWFGSPKDFFGFGIGKTLRSVQKEMSLRRGQQVRYADLYAYPWLALPADTQIDQNALQDVQKRKPLVFNGQPPQYIVPPTMPQTITQADEIARSDAQFISGTLDLSKGAQETNTVKTATGQQLFAQSQDKRINKARKAIGKYFRYVVINLFKLCRDNWPDDKIIAITDEEGNTNEFAVNGNALMGIDFDTDIDIQLDNIAVNENTLAERAIALYDKIKDDPRVKADLVFKDFLLKKGFRIKNPDKYVFTEDEMKQRAQAAQPVPPEGAPMPQAGAAMPDPEKSIDTGIGENIPDMTAQNEQI